MADLNPIVEKILAGVQGYVARSLAPFAARLKAVEDRQPEKGEAGATGAQGERGEKGEAGEPGAAGQTGERGATGEQGAKGDPGEAGAKGEAGERGEKGETGEPGAAGERGEKGDAGEPGPAGAKGDQGEPGQKGDPGEPGRPGEPGAKGDTGEPGQRGERGEKGDAGQDGRDALDIDIVESISPSKRFHRGTVASHRGGLWKAVRPTDLLQEDGDPHAAGWTCIVRGVADWGIELGADGRTVGVALEMSDQPMTMKSAKFPAVLDRGIYKGDGAYETGDGVTWDGSFWIAQRAVQEGEKPGDASGAWRLAVKRGRDGRDGLRGEKGERGGVLVTKG